MAGSFWKTFANHTSGKLRERHYWYSESVELEHRGLMICFDHYTHYATVAHHTSTGSVTRITVPFISRNDFRFEIVRTGFLHNIAVFFGAMDIKTGYEQFDREFVIKSNNENAVLKLLKNKEFRSSLESQEDVNLLIANRRGIWEEELPHGQLELGYYVDGQCENMAQLLSIYKIVCLCLDELIETHSIEKVSVV